ncbi:MAG: diaminopimelate decarboxylase [Planctomycetes bacterium GWA2_50_13]|nr:MAG: diaminopimelate decarboxylase [Planctomycetes bacterium GWA2_50_13]OHB94640.1 MAG: diaminopimelate decarboxylase [Planctomycetes bacterium RIFCSPLOWO2_02_FULL_50_16]OHC03642.1 MAG: diaminopimelate decarboxylase [Planctomycetes bacterium RIFCSPLOWO2_12_FULL_50_35]HCN19582.1 diaminopimelate decarboxylase [Planctomycetia bacterium]
MEEHFIYRDGALYCEDVKVEDIVRGVGSPAYIYSEKSVLDHYHELENAFKEAGPLICFSVKSNSNISILKLLADAGSGFDVVSGGELYRVLKAGGRPSKIVFAGIGKNTREIQYALDLDIFVFNVESREELDNINRVAIGVSKTARVALRLNPDIDPGTHAKTTTGKKENKFGIDIKMARELFDDDYLPSLKGVRLVGLHVHLGSPIWTPEPYVRALKKIKDYQSFCRKQGAKIEYINIGGGYCISYTGEAVARPADYAKKILPVLKTMGCKLIMEPGRFIVGNAGILVTRVTYNKESSFGKRFIICDAAMNDLIRPTLYDAFHRIWPVRPSIPIPKVLRPKGLRKTKKMVKADIVGPVCESSDYFAKDRILPDVKDGEYLAIFSAGAYGFTMSSNYNSRPRPCEVLVSGSKFRVIRRRETNEDLVACEV